MDITVSAVSFFPFTATGNKQDQEYRGNRCSSIVRYDTNRFEFTNIDAAASPVMVMPMAMPPVMMIAAMVIAIVVIMIMVIMTIVIAVVVPTSDQLACAWT